MPVIYIDCVFVFNMIADYFLFLITGRLAGIPLRRTRYFLAGFLGGIYAAAVFLPGGEILAAPWMKLSVGILLAVVAYGKEQKFFRLTVLLLLVSCGFAGCVLGLSLLLGEVPIVKGIFYTNINTKILAAVFASGYFLVAVMFQSAARHNIGGNLVPVRIWMQGRTASFSALLDTGNGLCDVFSGKPVLIIAPDVLPSILPRCVCEQITTKRLQEPVDLLEDIRRLAPELCPQLIPYRSVGMPRGFLLSIQTDKAEIEHVVYPKLRIALSSIKLGNGYSALWGGVVREEKKHVVISKTVEKSSAMGKAMGKSGSPLYWRK